MFVWYSYAHLCTLLSYINVSFAIAATDNNTNNIVVPVIIALSILLIMIILIMYLLIKKKYVLHVYQINFDFLQHENWAPTCTYSCGSHFCDSRTYLCKFKFVQNFLMVNRLSL